MTGARSSIRIAGKLVACPLTRGACALACFALVACLYTATPAFAEPSPWWRLTSNVQPANLAPGGQGTIIVRALNVGDGRTSGPLRLSDALPPGLKVQEAEVEGEKAPKVVFHAVGFEFGQFDLGSTGLAHGAHLCEAKASEVSCSLPPEIVPSVAPYEGFEIQVAVTNESAVSGDLHKASVTGGAGPAATAAWPLTVSASAPTFGVEQGSFSVTPEEEGGTVDSHAGSHPFQLTTTIGLHQTADSKKPPALARSLAVNLPAGLVGNVAALPQCSAHDFTEVIKNTGTVNLCPDNTVVGVAAVTVVEPRSYPLGVTVPVPVFNLEPGDGEPARLGFVAIHTVVTFDTAVRTGSDYGVTVSTSNITQLTSLLSANVTIWGVPGDPRHDESRGWGCLINGHWGSTTNIPCQPNHPKLATPFLTLPTRCGSPVQASAEGTAWPIRTAPGAEPVTVNFGPVPYTLEEAGHEVQLGECNQLPFAPSADVQPDTQQASTPMGITVRVRVPQGPSEVATGLASSTVKDITVSLPEGVTVNPASAGGLQACTEAEIGFQGEEGSTGTDLFTPAPPSCPEAAKIGTAEIITPVLPVGQHLKGAVYLAAQYANPFNSLIAMYLVARDPVSGVLVKVPGRVALDPVSGRVTTTFRNTPPLPFEEAIIKLFSGPRAPLASPDLCRRPGEEGFRTLASFDPWSGTGAVESAPEFDVTSGPSGSACPNPPNVQSPRALPFAPSLLAGTTNVRAGAYAPLTTTVSRQDGNQEIGALQLHMPPGLAATIASITPCGEAQANEGTCGSASLIGHADVSVGVGSTPFDVAGGQVYITGPYRGAAFGLSIAASAKAGPFDLGEGVCDCIVVRASLQIDPHTAQVTVTTDPSGPHAIPHMLRGIPLKIRQINATIDRTGFTFNPTNCEAQSVSATFTSDLGASANGLTPFQVADCTRLAFAPRFAVRVDGHASKANGTSLVATLAYPVTPPGTEANIAKVKVVLPKQLPSRLTTLQQACLAKVFETDRAKCPVHSVVGHATVVTPVLPVPLSGPAYFVSHGGEAFPSLTIVLQGDNVTIELIGSTLIRKGITSTTFKTTPDVPFTKFELTLPPGPFSALAAYGNLCTAKLEMPTEMIAQNGSRLDPATRIAVSHCPKHHKRRPARRSRVRRASHGMRGK